MESLSEVKETKIQEKKSKITLVDWSDLYEPENEFRVSLRKGYTLYPHQIEVIKWMKERANAIHCGIRGGILALKMGLGKTLISLSFIMSQETKMPSLVVCSKSVMYVWKQDIDKFFGSTCPYLVLHKDFLSDIDSITIQDLKRKKIVLTNYHTVMAAAKRTRKHQDQFLFNQFNKKIGMRASEKPENFDKLKGYNLILNFPWANVVADESQQFANPRTQTYYSMMTLWGKNMWCLSGTPIVNYSTDMYSQMKFLGYDKQNVTFNFNYHSYMQDKLYEVVKSMNYKEADIQLTELKYNVIYFEFYSEEEKVTYDYYDKMMKEVYNEFINGVASFACVLEMFLRQRQVCIAPYTLLQESSRKQKKSEKKEGVSQRILENMKDKLKEWLMNKNGTSGILSSKMKETYKILKTIPKDEKTLIFTTFKKVIDVLREGIKTFFPELRVMYLDGDIIGKKREQVLTDFRENKDISILLISYKVGSEGLNLTEANNVILTDSWWSPVATEQAKARVHRLGQKKVVNVWKLFAKCSIESKMEEICQTKMKMTDKFLSRNKNTKNEAMSADVLRKIIF